MKKETITKGSVLETLAGYMIVTGYNGHIVDVDEYEINEVDEAEKVDERRLTLNEIGHEMRAVDGKNRIVRFKGGDE